MTYGKYAITHLHQPFTLNPLNILQSLGDSLHIIQIFVICAVIWCNVHKCIDGNILNDIHKQ